MSDDNTFGTRTAVEGMDDAVIKRDEAAAPPKSSETAVEQQPPKKKKHKTGEGHTRVRRVGRVPTKSSEEILSAMNQGGQQQQQQPPQLAQSPESVTLGEAAAVAAAACVMETPPPPAPLFKVQSKHDEKWNKMFNELVEYKKHFNTTNVPQCYDKNVRLGRWTHYQRGQSILIWLCRRLPLDSLILLLSSSNLFSFMIFCYTQSNIGFTNPKARPRSMLTALLG